MSSDHDSRRAREDNRNEHHTRLHAERLHDEAQIMHLDPDAARMAANARLVLERAARLLEEQPHLLTDWRFVYSRVITPETCPSFDGAVSRAAHSLILADMFDRADELDPTSGDAA